MADSVGVANLALIRVGAQIISSLDQEGSKSARVIFQIWDIIRDEVLEAHPWKFATKVAELAQLSATPTNRWDYAYKLPANFCKDRFLGEPEHDYKYDIVGDELHTNQDEATLTYTGRIENVGKWPAHFCSTFAFRLGVDIAVPLVGAKGKTIRNDMMESYLVALRDAKTFNDSQGNDPDDDLPTQWTDVRI